MNDHLAQIQRLTKALFASGALNIVLLVLLIYWGVKDRPPVPYFEHKPASRHEQQAPVAMGRSNGQVVRQFRTLSLEQLAAKLTDAQLVENGYAKRDLALACMTAMHHFDLQRALLGLTQPVEHRLLAYGRHRDGTPAEIIVYPGLTDAQFAAIIQYARTEKWPLTSKGLFLMLQKDLNKGQADPSLADAFYLTPEFLTVERLFNRPEKLAAKSELLKVICEGDWKTLSHFFEQQRIAQDLSTARRQWFLLQYIDLGSKSAAYLMLRTDGEFARRRLEDRHILALLELLAEKTPEAEQFAVFQLNSPRSDAVRKMAEKRLSQYRGL